MKESKGEKCGKGFIIAFVGQDGAGKTTLSNIMSEKLKKNNDVQSMYLGSGENYSSTIKSIYKSLEKSNKSLFIKELSGMMFYVEVAKSCAKKMKIAQKKTENGTIIFLDRCPQIQFEGINDGPKIKAKYGNSSNRVIRYLYPYFRKNELKYLEEAVDIPPDIVIKLQLSVEESMRRKPDNDINKLKIKHKIIDKLKFPKSKVIEVDATQPLEQEILEISTHLGEFVLCNTIGNKNERQRFIEQIQEKENHLKIGTQEHHEVYRESEYDDMVH